MWQPYRPVDLFFGGTEQLSAIFPGEGMLRELEAHLDSLLTDLHVVIL